MGLFDEGTGNHSTILQHIFQVYQITVVHMLSIIIRIMEMDNACLMGLYNILGQQDAGCDVLADFTCHVVTLNCIDSGILIGILLLDLFVVALNEAENAIVCGIGLTQQTANIPVCDIHFGNFKGTMRHNGLFHQVLDFFHSGTSAHFLTGNHHALGDTLYLQRRHANLLFHSFIGFGNGIGNLGNIKCFLRTVSLNNLHTGLLGF